MNDELMREVDGAMRAHQFRQLWDRFGKQSTTLIAIVAIVMIALLIWKEQEKKASYAASETLLQASAWLSQDTPEGKFKAREILEAESFSGPHEQIRQLWLASIYRDTGNDAQAAELLAVETAQGDDLLNQLKCLAQASGTSGGCIRDIGLRAINQEYTVMRLLSEGNISEAQLQLPPKGMDVMQERRLSDLRAYLASSVVQPDAPAEIEEPQPADAPQE